MIGFSVGPLSLIDGMASGCYNFLDCSVSSCMEEIIIMWASTDWKDYELLDCGRGEKLERWGKYTLVRPDPQAI